MTLAERSKIKFMDRRELSSSGLNIAFTDFAIVLLLSVTIFGDLLDFEQLFKFFGNN